MDWPEVVVYGAGAAFGYAALFLVTRRWGMR